MKVAPVWILCLLLFAIGCRDAEKSRDVAEETVPGILPKEQISTYIRCILEDKHGNLWMGTTEEGVYRYDGDVLVRFGKPEGLAGVCVKDIMEDKGGAVWFATEGGLSKFDGSHFINYTGQDGLSSNDVWSVMEDRHGALWVGTAKGLCRFDGSSFKSVPLPVTEMSSDSRLPPAAVVGIMQDKTGNIWFATAGEGLRRFDGTKFTSFTRADGLSSNNIWCLAQDRAGNVWIGTRGGGANRYDGKSFTTFTQKEGLCGNAVGEITEDRSGNIWMGTSGEGVSRYDGRAFKTFRDETGITQNQVQSVFEDSKGNVWVGFSGGLFRVQGERLVNVTKDGPWP